MREIKFKFILEDEYSGALYCSPLELTFDEIIECTDILIHLIEDGAERQGNVAANDAFYYTDWTIKHKIQYTGLKDKNGVEIYEFMELDNSFEVTFKDGCYVLTNISNGDIIPLYNYIKDKNGQVKITKEYTKV